MITIRPGSHILQLLQLLATAGEIPTSVLPLLGNERVLSVLVHKLESVQDIRFGKNGSVHRVRLIQVSGKKGDRSIRLYRKGLPVLDELHPDLLRWYLDAFRDHTFTNDLFHTERNHRIAEVLAICMVAGVETRPYVLPMLRKVRPGAAIPEVPSLYFSRAIKNADEEANKTMYTRIIGALFKPGGVYAVYNTRAAVMKWSGRGETKAADNLLELARVNAGVTEAKAAMLLGQSPDVAVMTILESDKSRRRELRFDRVYNQIHFVPFDQNGVRLIKLLVSPDWNEKLLSELFTPNQRSYNRGVMEYDAVADGRLIMSHIDGDIARLIRFRDALHDQPKPADVICFPWQAKFLKTYLDGRAEIRVLEMEAVESAIKT